MLLPLEDAPEVSQTQPQDCCCPPSLQAIVAYRDFGDGPLQLERHDFVGLENIEGLLAKVRGLKAFGGGDGPEDVAGALEVRQPEPPGRVAGWVNGG
jgi:hypothetical protein